MSVRSSVGLGIVCQRSPEMVTPSNDFQEVLYNSVEGEKLSMFNEARDKRSTQRRISKE